MNTRDTCGEENAAPRPQSMAKSVESAHSWDQNPGAWILAGVPPTELGHSQGPLDFPQCKGILLTLAQRAHTQAQLTGKPIGWDTGGNPVMKSKDPSAEKIIYPKARPLVWLPCYLLAKSRRMWRNEVLGPLTDNVRAVTALVPGDCRLWPPSIRVVIQIHNNQSAFGNDLCISTSLATEDRRRGRDKTTELPSSQGPGERYLPSNQPPSYTVPRDLQSSILTLQNPYCQTQSVGTLPSLVPGQRKPAFLCRRKEDWACRRLWVSGPWAVLIFSRMSARDTGFLGHARQRVV